MLRVVFRFVVNRGNGNGINKFTYVIAGAISSPYFQFRDRKWRDEAEGGGWAGSLCAICPTDLSGVVRRDTKHTCGEGWAGSL
jgi:hypothetical protein